MIAEIHRKISSNGSNLSDRLEDQLTGDVFGTIRYLPAELGLRYLLSQVRFQSSDVQDLWQTRVDNLRGYNTKYLFWPSHAEGEIDLLLDDPNVLIGIEVKYFSSLSSEDDDIERAVDPEESRNQLARYARMLADLSGSRPAYLIFLTPLDILTQVETAMEGVILSNRM